MLQPLTTLNMKNVNLLAILLAFAVVIAGCSGGGENTATTSSDETTAAADLGGQASVSEDSAPNIVKIAVGSEDHTTLVAAIKAAGLVDVLANNGPFTVFAPTNAAFDALPAGTLDDLLKPENKSTLVNIIHYHAAPGIYKDKLLKDGYNMYMANGKNVLIEVAEDGSVTANGANILGTVDATNGVIHVVDAVLLPPE